MLRRINTNVAGLSVRCFANNNNVLNSQHLRYVPKKRLNFDYLSADGPMALVFQADDQGGAKAFAPHTWKVTLATTFPAYYYAQTLSLGPQL